MAVLLAILLHWYLFSKNKQRNVFWIIDRVVIPTALAAMFIRLGNLFNSEIYGVQTSLAMGFYFRTQWRNLTEAPHSDCTRLWPICLPFSP
jgi:phosphatidylglycerol---prolipoprotein diacylglyceryl transferase